MNIKPFAVAVAIAGLAGCGSLGNATAGTGSTAALSSSSASCPDQLAAWRDANGGNKLTIVNDDLNVIRDATTVFADDLSAGNDTTSDQGQLDSAAGTLQSDTQAAGASLPPSCVPGMRAAESAMLSGAGKAAAETENAVKEMGGGNAKGAVSVLLVAQKQLGAASKQYDSAVSDAQAFGGAG